MKRFLAPSFCYSPIYRCAPVGHCKDLDILGKWIPENDEEVEEATPFKNFPKDDPRFSSFTEEEYLNLPVVHTDGGCVSVKGGKKAAAIGVYWGVESRFNLALPCVHPPFTNQRAELEAILMAVSQAKERGLTHLLLCSDSAYAVQCLNHHITKWRLDPTGDPNEPQVLLDKNGQQVKNSDLFCRIQRVLSRVVVQLFHVRRAFNQEADALANQALVAIGKSESAKIAAITRSANRLPEKLTDQRLVVPNPLYNYPIEDDDSPVSFGDDDFYILMSEGSDEEYPSSPIIVPTEEAEEENALLQLEMEALNELPVEEAQPWDFPFNHSLPRTALPPWTDQLVSSKELIKHVPQNFRAEGPHLNELLNSMVALPMAQQKDPDLQWVWNCLNNDGERTLDPRAEKQIHRYSLQRETNAITYQTQNGQTRFVVPVELQEKVMGLFHSSPSLGGHLYHATTLCHIQRYFVWKHMALHVKLFCQSCQTCLAAKSRTGKVPGFLTPPALPKGPLYRVHADTIRCLPRSNRLQHVLIVMDSFTKYIFTHPIPTLDPLPILDGFTAIFSRFGPPTILVADNGTEFSNKECLAFLKLWGVHPHFPSAYNPQANGQAEAGVKIITQRMQTALMDASSHLKTKYPWKAWPMYLPYITMTYNHSPNVTTGFSPHELMFGRVPQLPIQDPGSFEQTHEQLTHLDHLVVIRSALTEAHEFAKERLRLHRERIKRVFDKFRQPLKIDKGDFVYILYPYNQKIRKLHPKAFGPFEVIEVSHLPHTMEVVGVTVNSE